VNSLKEALRWISVAGILGGNIMVWAGGILLIWKDKPFEGLSVFGLAALVSMTWLNLFVELVLKD